MCIKKKKKRKKITEFSCRWILNELCFHLWFQEFKPHIFIVAEEAYRNVRGHLEPVDQSLVVSGESGAGKVNQHNLCINSVTTDPINRDSNFMIMQCLHIHDAYLPAGLRFSLLTTALPVLPVCYLFGGTLLSNQLICFAK